MVFQVVSTGAGCWLLAAIVPQVVAKLVLGGSGCTQVLVLTACYSNLYQFKAVVGFQEN